MTVSTAVFATPRVAVIVGVVLTATEDVVIAKLAEFAPPKTITLGGGVATGELELARVTEIPALGAGPVNVIVPVEPVPPVTLVGESVSESAVGASTVSVADFVTPSVAEIVTGVLGATGFVWMLNIADVIPAETVTFAGGEATAELPVVSVTEIPPLGAAPFNVTVPMLVAPPITLLGDRPRVSIAGGFTVSKAFFATPSVAVMVVGVAAETGAVGITNVAVVAPPRTVTGDGGVAAPVLLPSVTEIPPLGAGPVKVIVAETFFPPVTLVAARASVETDGGFTINCADIPALLKEAVMFTGVELDTGTVVIGKVALDNPAKTVTVPCVAATDGVSLDREMLMPPMGAGPFNFTVPVEFFPPATLVGDKVTDSTADGLTVSGSCFTEAPLLAVMVIGLELSTASVVMLNVALVNPAGIVTLG